MRLVVTNAHKNPIIFDSPWMHAEDEEAHLALGAGRQPDKGEGVYIDVPSPNGGDPQALIYVSHVRVDDTTTRMVVEIHREGDGPEDLIEWTIESEDGA